MDEPLITIGITCYNEGDWILECWDSVLAQTDDRWEAVLVMDGTRHERTIEIFNQLEHPKLKKYAFSENVGPYIVRNRAFELTKTPYHFYLDGDDQLPPTCLEYVIRTFRENPSAAFVYGDVECFGEIEETWSRPKSYTFENLLSTRICYGPNAYSTDAWREIGGFSTDPLLARGQADKDFHIGLAEAGLRGVHCDHVFYKYRRRAGAVSGSYSTEGHIKHSTMIRRHPKFFRNRDFAKHFLEDGYDSSINHCLDIPGGRSLARELAISAIKDGLWNRAFYWKVILPERLESVLRALKHRLCRAQKFA